MNKGAIWHQTCLRIRLYYWSISLQFSNVGQMQSRDLEGVNLQCIRPKSMGSHPPVPRSALKDIYRLPHLIHMYCCVILPSFLKALVIFREGKNADLDHDTNRKQLNVSLMTVFLSRSCLISDGCLLGRRLSDTFTGEDACKQSDIARNHLSAGHLCNFDGWLNSNGDIRPTHA